MLETQYTKNSNAVTAWERCTEPDPTVIMSQRCRRTAVVQIHGTEEYLCLKHWQQKHSEKKKQK